MKRFKVILLLFLFMFLYCPLIFAVTLYPVEGVYKVTVKKIEVSYNNGTSYTTVINKTQQFDIMSVNSGQAVAAYAGEAVVPPGTMTHIRVTLSTTATARGNVYVGGGTDTTYWTTAAGGTSSAGQITDTSLMAGYSEMTAAFRNSNGASEIVYVFSLNTPLNVAIDSPQKFRIDFDSEEALIVSGGELLISAPTISITNTASDSVQYQN